MNPNTSFALAMSCFIPALIGVIRYKKIDPAYYPFVWVVCYDFFNEFTAGLPSVLYQEDRMIDIMYTFYPFIASYLYLLFFIRIKLIKKSLPILLIPPIAFGLYALFSLQYEHPFFHTPLLTYFDAGFGLFNIIMAIILMGSQVTQTKTSAFKNPKIIIAFGYILMNTFFVFVKLLILMDLFKGTAINNDIYTIFKVLNSFSYLIYAWAIIWIPPLKRKY